MKYLNTYENYIMNYPDMYNIVSDYIETDFYTFVVDEIETEPLNKTGIDDRERKNTKKKSIYTISP